MNKVSQERAIKIIYKDLQKSAKSLNFCGFYFEEFVFSNLCIMYPVSMTFDLEFHVKSAHNG